MFEISASFPQSLMFDVMSCTLIVLIEDLGLESAGAWYALSKTIISASGIHVICCWGIERIKMDAESHPSSLPILCYYLLSVLFILVTAQFYVER